MRKAEILQKQCQRIRQSERKIYEGIRLRQEKLQKEIEHQEAMKKCKQDRENNIKGRNIVEQVTHPYNDRGGMWVYLANCLHEDQKSDLDSIKLRQEERRKFRQQLEQEKQLQRLRRQYIQKPVRQFDEQLNGEQGGRKGKQNKQVPWNLMRKIREHDVLQNKKRMQKIRQNQLQQAKSYHS